MTAFLGKGTNFTDFRQRVNDFDSLSSDSFAMSNKITFAEDDYIRFMDDQAGGLFAGAQETGKMNDWALNQISERLDGPTAWITDPKHCPADMKVNILNELAQRRDPARYLIRSNNGTIRAILSDQYSRFDNKSFIDLVADALDTFQTGAQVHRAEVGDNLRAYVTLPQITLAADPTVKGSQFGDGGLHPAVYIRNSEIGGGAASLHGAVWRQICSNGAIAWSKSTETFSIRHRFWSSASMGMIVADSLAQALQMSKEITAAFIRSQESKIESKNVVKSLINQWSKEYGLSVAASDNWLSATLAESSSYGRVDDIRTFDLVNGATAVAQQRGVAERETMERLAGEILQPFMSRQVVER